MHLTNASPPPQVQELNGELHTLRMQKTRVESELNELLSRHESETEEWQQFQKDLQVAVVIANDFRAETQEGMHKVSEENLSLREKSLNLQLELDRLRSELQAFRSTKAFEESRSPAGRAAAAAAILSNAELKGKVSGERLLFLMIFSSFLEGGGVGVFFGLFFFLVPFWGGGCVLGRGGVCLK